MRRLTIAVALLGSFAAVAEPGPSREAETGVMDVPFAESMGLGDAALGGEFRADLWHGNPGSIGPSPLSLVAGLSHGLEAGVFAHQGDLPGEQEKSPFLFGAALKLHLLDAGKWWPAIAVDAVADSVNLNATATARLILSTRPLGPVRLTAVGGPVFALSKPFVVAPAGGLAVVVRLRPELDVAAEGLAGGQGYLVGTNLRWAITPHFSISAGVNWRPTESAFRFDIGVSYNSAAPVRPEAESTLTKPAVRPVPPAQPRFRDSVPTLKLRIKAPPVPPADIGRHLQYGPETPKAAPPDTAEPTPGSDPRSGATTGPAAKKTATGKAATRTKPTASTGARKDEATVETKKKEQSVKTTSAREALETTAAASTDTRKGTNETKTKEPAVQTTPAKEAPEATAAASTDTLKSTPAKGAPPATPVASTDTRKDEVTVETKTIVKSTPTREAPQTAPAVSTDTRKDEVIVETEKKEPIVKSTPTREAAPPIWPAGSTAVRRDEAAVETQAPEAIVQGTPAGKSAPRRRLAASTVARRDEAAVETPAREVIVRATPAGRAAPQTRPAASTVAPTELVAIDTPATAPCCCTPGALRCEGPIHAPTTKPMCCCTAEVPCFEAPIPPEPTEPMLRSAQASSPGPGEIASASASEDKLREQDALELREADLRAEEQRLSTAEKALALRKSALLEKTGALDERERKLVEKEAAVASLNAPAGRKHPRTVAPVGLLEARLFEEEGVHRAEEKKLADTVHGLESQLAAKSREQTSLKARVNTLRKALKRSAEPAVTAQSELVDARTQLVSLQEAHATLDGQRVAANERRLAEREARLTALETRLVAAGTPPELLQTGDAGRKQLSAAVRSHQRDLKHCLEDELKLTQSANASHVLQITLDARGRVTRAEVPGAADSPIEKCLKNAASAWRFPASDKDYDLEIPLHVGGRGGL